MKKKQMNVLLWVLQVILALYNFAGGFYMINNVEKIASVWAWKNLHQPFWTIFGIVQILLAIGLVLPKMKKLNTISAAILAIISLLGIVLYDAYAGFPGMLWAIIPALLAAFVAYKRYRNI